MDNLNSYYESLQGLLLAIIPDLLLAIFALLVGLWIIKWITRISRKGLERSQAEPSLSKFLVSLTSITLKVLLIISIASMVGIATTSFIAVLGAAGLAVGLSLQGSLANFAGGVIILLFKPFKVGDVIEAQGYVAIVHEIQVFNTILKSFDNKTIFIPNGQLSNSSITNYSMETQRRVDMTFGISYDDDIAKAKSLLHQLVDADERILKEPQPVIVLSGLGESSVDFTVRVWAKAEDYWNIYFDMQEQVKQRFDENNITIPFPQRDVHMFQNNKTT